MAARNNRPRAVRNTRAAALAEAIELVAKVTVPLGGFHIGDRHLFAAFNMGRLQEAMVQALSRLAAKEGK